MNVTDIIQTIIDDLPIVIDEINKLTGLNIPDVAGTIKMLSNYVQRTISTLQRSGVMTDEQAAQLDARIAAHKDEPWWNETAST